MKLARFVPVFVTACLALFGSRPALAYERKPAPAPLVFTVKMGDVQGLAKNANGQGQFAVNPEYTFWKIYAIGVEASYTHQFTQMEDYLNTGMDDASLYFLDKEIWANHYDNITLSGRLAAIMPTSKASKVATQLLRTQQGLVLKKGFTGWLALSYGFTANEYYHDYDIAYEDANDTVYNTRTDFINKIGLTFDPLRDLHLSAWAQVRTFTNYNNETYNIYSLISGVSYDYQKNASLDFLVRTNMKNESAPYTWDGPPVSGHFYDGNGTVIVVGTTIKI